MKKIISALLAASMLTVFTVILPSCSANALDAPGGVMLNPDTLTLSWSEVDEARGYGVLVTDAASGETVREDSMLRTSYSLEGLDEGDYTIMIRALGDGEEFGDSAWASYDFHREYENGCLYELINNNTEYEIIGYGSSGSEVELGGLYRGKPVTSVGDTAFRGSLAESVVITDTVTRIGERAFYNNTHLVSVSIPDSVAYIGPSAFQNCVALSDINLPSGLTEISDDMFNYCRALGQIDLPDGLTRIGQSAFANCSSLTEVSIPSTVTEIDEYAFMGTALEEITLGGDLQTIGDNVFNGVQTLAAAYLSGATELQSIGEGAFEDCTALQLLTFPQAADMSEIGINAFSGCTSLASVTLPEGLKSLDNYVFYGCENLADVTIPESVTSVGANVLYGTSIYQTAADSGETYVFADNWLVGLVGENAASLTAVSEDSFGGREVVGIADLVFANLAGLEGIVLPLSVRYIGYAAFAYSGITRFVVNIGASLHDIGNYAFYMCENLSHINLMDSGLVSIGNYAFYGCTLVSNNENNPEMLVPGTVEHIGMMAFYDTGVYESASAEDMGVVYAGNWVVGYQNYEYGFMYAAYQAQGDPVSAANIVASYSLPSTISLRDETQGIADGAFYGHYGLSTLNNVSDVSHIGHSAFYWCDSLGSISLGRNVTSIEDYTFYQCGSLRTISFDNVTSIGRSAFYGCTGLTGIDLSGGLFGGVESLGDFAFYGCSALADIDLGDDITQIGRYCFFDCALTELTIPDSVTALGDHAFAECTELGSLQIGAGLTEIPDFAFVNCSSLVNIDIPANIDTVGSYAYYGCSAATSLNLADGVSQIGDYAFARLINISRIAIPASVVSVGDYAFRGCAGLQMVILPSSVEYVGDHAFFGCTAATIYSDASSIAPYWSSTWNSSYRPVIWDSVLSEDGSYVVSVIVSGTAENVNSFNPEAAPVRIGYEFVGWAEEEGATEAVYEAGQLGRVPAGTTLYAVWQPL